MSLPELERLKEYSFEIGPIRPPSEGGSRSLLIRELATAHGTYAISVTVPLTIEGGFN